MNSRFPAREAGMTTLGFMIIAVFVSLIAFGTLRLTPVYLNYMKVAGVLDGVHTEFDGQSPTRGAIRTSISRRFDVESVSVISAKNIVVTAENNGFVVAATYDPLDIVVMAATYQESASFLKNRRQAKNV